MEEKPGNRDSAPSLYRSSSVGGGISFPTTAMAAGQSPSPIPHAATPLRLYYSSTGNSPAEAFPPYAANAACVAPQPVTVTSTTTRQTSVTTQHSTTPPPVASLPTPVSPQELQQQQRQQISISAAKTAAATGKEGTAYIAEPPPRTGNEAADSGRCDYAGGDSASARRCYVCDVELLLRGSAADRRRQWDAHLGTALHHRLAQQRATAANNSPPSGHRTILHGKGGGFGQTAASGPPPAARADARRRHTKGGGHSRKHHRSRSRDASAHDEEVSDEDDTDDAASTNGDPRSLSYSGVDEDAAGAGARLASTQRYASSVQHSSHARHASATTPSASLPRPHDISVLSITNESTPYAASPYAASPLGDVSEERAGPQDTSSSAVLPPEELSRLLQQDAERRQRRREERESLAMQSRSEVALMRRCMHRWYTAFFVRAVAPPPFAEAKTAEEEARGEEENVRRHRQGHRRRRGKHRNSVRQGQGTAAPRESRQPCRGPTTAALTHVSASPSPAVCGESRHQRDQSPSHDGKMDRRLWLSTRQKAYATVRLVNGVVVPATNEDDSRELEVDELAVRWHVTEGKGARRTNGYGSAPPGESLAVSRQRRSSSSTSSNEDVHQERHPLRHRRRVDGGPTPQDMNSQEVRGQRPSSRHQRRRPTRSPTAAAVGEDEEEREALAHGQGGALRPQQHPRRGVPPQQRDATAEGRQRTPRVVHYSEAPHRGRVRPQPEPQDKESPMTPRRRRPDSGHRWQTRFTVVEGHRLGSPAAAAAADEDGASQRYPFAGSGNSPVDGRGGKGEGKRATPPAESATAPLGGEASPGGRGGGGPTRRRRHAPHGPQQHGNASDGSGYSEEEEDGTSNSYSSNSSVDSDSSAETGSGGGGNSRSPHNEQTNDAHSPFDEDELSEYHNSDRGGGVKRRGASPLGYSTPISNLSLHQGPDAAAAVAVATAAGEANREASIRFLEEEQEDEVDGREEGGDVPQARHSRRHHHTDHGRTRSHGAAAAADSSAYSSDASQSPREEEEDGRPPSRRGRRGVGRGRYPPESYEPDQHSFNMAQDTSQYEDHRDMSTGVDTEEEEEDGRPLENHLTRTEGHAPVGFGSAARSASDPVAYRSEPSKSQDRGTRVPGNGIDSPPRRPEDVQRSPLGAYDDEVEGDPGRPPTYSDTYPSFSSSHSSRERGPLHPHVEDASHPLLPVGKRHELRYPARGPGSPSAPHQNDDDDLSPFQRSGPSLSRDENRSDASSLSHSTMITGPSSSHRGRRRRDDRGHRGAVRRASGWSSDSDIQAMVARLSPHRQDRVRDMLDATPSMSSSSHRRARRRAGSGGRANHGPTILGDVISARQQRSSGPRRLADFPQTATLLERLKAPPPPQATPGASPHRDVPLQQPGQPSSTQGASLTGVYAGDGGGLLGLGPACTPPATPAEDSQPHGHWAPATPPPAEGYRPFGSHSRLPPAPTGEAGGSAGSGHERPATHSSFPDHFVPVVATLPDHSTRVVYLDPVTGLTYAMPPSNAASSGSREAGLNHSLPPHQRQPQPQEANESGPFATDGAIGGVDQPPLSPRPPSLSATAATPPTVVTSSVATRWRRQQEGPDPMGYFRLLSEPPPLLHTASGPIAASRTPAAAVAGGRAGWRTTEAVSAENGEENAPLAEPDHVDLRRPASAFFDRDEAYAALRREALQQQQQQRERQRGRVPEGTGEEETGRDSRGGRRALDRESGTSGRGGYDRGPSPSGERTAHAVGRPEESGPDVSGGFGGNARTNGPVRDGGGRRPHRGNHSRKGSSSSSSSSPSGSLPATTRSKEGGNRPATSAEETDSDAGDSSRARPSCHKQPSLRGRDCHRGGGGGPYAEDGAIGEGEHSPVAADTDTSHSARGSTDQPLSRKELPRYNHTVAAEAGGWQERADPRDAATHTDRNTAGATNEARRWRRQGGGGGSPPRNIPDTARGTSDSIATDGAAGSLRQGRQEPAAAVDVDNDDGAIFSLSLPTSAAVVVDKSLTTPATSTPSSTGDAVAPLAGTSPAELAGSKRRHSSSSASSPSATAGRPPHTPASSSGGGDRRNEPGNSRHGARHPSNSEKQHSGEEGLASPVSPSLSASQLPHLGQPGGVYVCEGGRYHRVPDLSAEAMHNLHGEPIYVVATAATTRDPHHSPHRHSATGAEEDPAPTSGDPASPDEPPELSASGHRDAVGDGNGDLPPTPSAHGQHQQPPKQPGEDPAPRVPPHLTPLTASLPRDHSPHQHQHQQQPQQQRQRTASAAASGGGGHASQGTHRDEEEARTSPGRLHHKYRFSTPTSATGPSFRMGQQQRYDSGASASASAAGGRCDARFGSLTPTASLVTRGRSPVGCGRLNPYCSVCRAKFNLILVDSNMHPVRWPSPRATGLQQLGECRYRDGYVFGGPTAEPLVPLPCSSWATDSGSGGVRPSRGSTPPPLHQHRQHQQHFSRSPCRGLSASGTFVPVRFRKVSAVASPTQYSYDNPDIALSPTAVATSPSPATTASISSGQHRPSEPEQQRQVGEILFDPPPSPRKEVAGAARATEQEPRQEREARRQRREVRRLRKHMKQLLWQDPPAQRDSEEFDAYLHHLSDGLDMLCALASRQGKG